MVEEGAVLGSVLYACVVVSIFYYCFYCLLYCIMLSKTALYSSLMFSTGTLKCIVLIPNEIRAIDLVQSNRNV